MSQEQSINQFNGQPRLPKFAIPKRYSIKLKPDLTACVFTGEVSIELDVVEETKFIVLNAVDLIIRHPCVEFEIPHYHKVFRPAEIVQIPEDEILILGFDEFLQPGRGLLRLNFEGILNDKMKGFYRSTYDHDGEKKVMAVTQFEPADARRCFPCWDEPAFKATFKITLEVSSELVALSNMPVIEEKLDGPVKRVSFQETPIMSTYLVAVVIGRLDYVEDFTPDGAQVRVYCQVGKTNLGKFALDVAVRTLILYGKYFSVPYILPKLDMVAIPDFAFGAMENYGLVTYRETALLYDDLHSSATNKQRVANVVAHELAHQWFGNLVTMEWWTHLWLNEGFATWVSYLSMDTLFPDWEVWTQFLGETTEGLRLDALAESHPIEVEINHAREIDEIFDSISYRKGAAVIGMLQNYLGAECFQKALASYIRKYSYSNAKTKDLWAVLESYSGEPVTRIMSSWTKQKGYPLIDVKMKNGKLHLEQSHFLTSGCYGEGQWVVPVTLCCGSYDKKRNFLLQGDFEELEVAELLGSSDTESDFQEKGEYRQVHSWIKLNVEHAGFYRVKYDDDLAARLTYAIETGALFAMDRFGILDDSFALCMARKQTLSSLLSLMNAFKEESNYTVLSCLTDVCCKVAKLMADAIPEVSDDVKEIFMQILALPARRLGWENKQGESHLDAMLRGEILAALADFGHIPTMQEAARRFYAFLDDRHTSLLPADIRKATFVAVMRAVSTSNRSGYNYLLKIYRETDLSVEKARILSALTSSPDPEIVFEALNFLLSSEVRSQDVFHGLAGISREGRETAWSWLKKNWDYISKHWTGLLLGRFISAITSMFHSDEKAEQVADFFESRTNPSFSRTLKQSIERIRINAMWVNSVRDEKHIRETVQQLSTAVVVSKRT